MELRKYQEEISTNANKILEKYNIVALYLAVRVGKTFISLETAKKYNAKKVLFITKKKAISSIESDYSYYKDNFDIVITNYESLHKVEDTDFDLVILDEVHGTLSSFPKPSKANIIIKKKFSHLPFILLSGTPLIESCSKIYHQLKISNYSPFKEYKNFYKWFKIFGIPKVIYTNYGQTADYSHSKYDDILESINHLIITFTQKDAGFETKITEHILNVKMKPITYKLVEQLTKDRVIESAGGEVILADTGVKLQICLHELYSGTLKLESGKAVTIDDTKAKFVKEYFKGKKIAIMYCFVQERVLLKEIFGDTITDDLEEFNNSDKNYLGQIRSTREGVSLKKAEALVFYNIAFSGTSWEQGKDRMSYLGREKNDVYVICSEGGIEKKIYDIVKKKGSFSNRIFKRSCNIK